VQEGESPEDAWRARSSGGTKAIILDGFSACRRFYGLPEDRRAQPISSIALQPDSDLRSWLMAAHERPPRSSSGKRRPFDALGEERRLALVVQ
jgi:hypothetical protein